jgi:hypothetical protein
MNKISDLICLSILLRRPFSENWSDFIGRKMMLNAYEVLRALLYAILLMTCVGENGVMKMMHYTPVIIYKGF